MSKAMKNIIRVTGISAMSISLLLVFFFYRQHQSSFNVNENLNDQSPSTQAKIDTSKIKTDFLWLVERYRTDEEFARRMDNVNQQISQGDNITDDLTGIFYLLTGKSPIEDEIKLDFLKLVEQQIKNASFRINQPNHIVNRDRVVNGDVYGHHLEIKDIYGNDLKPQADSFVLGQDYALLLFDEDSNQPYREVYSPPLETVEVSPRFSEQCPGAMLANGYSCVPINP